jgi:hypothetical protein
MGRTIVKLADEKYVEWSSIVDAPVTYIMTREEMKTYLDEEYGRSSIANNEERLRRTDERGTSSFCRETMEEVISCNRAGPHEEHIELEEIIKQYTDKGEENG